MFLSEWCEFPSAPCLARKKKLDDSSRLDVVEVARVPDMLLGSFTSWSGQGLISTPVCSFQVWTSIHSQMFHDTVEILKTSTVC